MMLFSLAQFWAALKISLFLALVGGLSFLAVARMPDRVDVLAQPPEFAVSDEMVPANVATSLLHALADAGVLFLNPKNMTLNVPPSDVHLQIRAQRNGAIFPDPQFKALKFWARALSGSNSAEAIDAIEKFHRRGPTEVGSVLRAEFEAWNSQHALVAIRDSQARNDGRSPWTAIGQRTRPYAPDKLLAMQSQLLTEEFGFFGFGAAPPQGPWAAVRAKGKTEGVARPSVTMRRSLPAGDDLVIDVLGKFVTATGLDNTGSTQTLLCHDPTQYSSETGVPDAACTTNDDLARRITVDAADQDRVLEITVQPVRNVPAVLFEALAVKEDIVRLKWATCGDQASGWSDYRNTCEKAGWLIYGDVRPVVLMCRAPDDEGSAPDCAIGWSKGPGRGIKRIAPNIHINLADGSPLLHMPGDIPNLIGVEGDLARQLDEVKRLGLHPLLGSGRGDTQGLIGGLRAHYAKQVPTTETDVPRGTRAITLSIDRSLQEAVVEAISDDGEIFAGGDAVSFVLLEASDRCWQPSDDGCGTSSDRGVIRAAFAAEIGRDQAGVIRPSVNLDFSQGVWNYLASAAWKRRIGMEVDALAPFAWTSPSGKFAPGSTFKAVTALAAIEHVTRFGNEEMKRSIIGLPDALDAARVGPLPNGATVETGYVQFRSEPNSRFPTANCGDDVDELRKNGGGRICNLSALEASKPTEERCASSTQPRFGMCEAIHDSVNNYFVAMGLALEAAQPSHVTGGSGDPAIVAMARRLVDDNYSLVPEEGNMGNLYSRFRGNGFAAIESAEDFYVDVAKVFAVGQNAYGHNIQANTATIAAVYGAIATGCRANPSLQGTARPCEPIFEGSEQERWGALSLMETTLVRGLKSVVEVEGTTATFLGERYGDLRARLHAKTGTAGFGTTNTVWLAGWLDPPKAAPGGKRYAFACMVKNVRPGNFGGSICGPIALKVLEEVVERER